MITVTTVRDVIKNVADRWALQYEGTIRPEKIAIGEKLKAMNLETASAKDVAKVIGNTSWTNLECDSCGASNLPIIITVGAPPEIESRTANLCMGCCKLAWKMTYGKS